MTGKKFSMTGNYFCLWKRSPRNTLTKILLQPIRNILHWERNLIESIAILLKAHVLLIHKNKLNFFPSVVITNFVELFFFRNSQICWDSAELNNRLRLAKWHASRCMSHSTWASSFGIKSLWFRLYQVVCTNRQAPHKTPFNNRKTSALEHVQLRSNESWLSFRNGFAGTIEKFQLLVL